MDLHAPLENLKTKILFIKIGLFAIVVPGLWISSGARSVGHRRYISYLILLCISAFIIALLNTHHLEEIVFLIALPYATIVSMSFEKMKSKYYPGILYFSVLLILLIVIGIHKFPNYLNIFTG